nr:MAG TPA: hypothetical protein [Caudoviricetes sp.]
MRRRSHHGGGDDFVTLTYWKVSNFIVNALMKGYHIAYYSDTNRIHYWRNGSTEYHIISIDNINLSETGIENGIYR